MTELFPRDVGAGVQSDSEGWTDARPGPDLQRDVQLSGVLHRSDND